MTSFPKLFKLPVVALERVIMSMKIMGIIDLASTSRKTRQIVEKSIYLDGFSLYAAYGCQEKNIGEVRIGKLNAHESLSITLFNEETESRSELDTPFRRRWFLGRFFEMRVVEYEQLEVLTTADIFTVCRELAELFKPFFHVKMEHFGVQVSIDPIDFPNVLGEFFAWEEANNAGFYTFYHAANQKTALLEIFDRYFREQKKSLTLCGEILLSPADLHFSDFPSFEWFRVAGYSECFPLETLLSLDARFLMFSSIESLTAADLNVFFKKWLEDVEFHKNLEFFSVSIRLKEEEDKRVVVDGINLLEYDGKRHPAYRSIKYSDFMHCYGFDCRKEKDIVRPRDGKVATLIVSDWAVSFIVWP